MAFKEKCRQAGLQENRIEAARSYRIRHKELTDEEVINRYLNPETTFIEKCKQMGLNKSQRSLASKYRKRHPEIEDSDVINIYINNGRLRDKIDIPEEIKQFRYKCRQAGFNNREVVYASRYRSRHPEFTDEQIINIYLTRNRLRNKQKSDENFSDKCRNMGVSEEKLGSAYGYRRRNPELTDEQAIVKCLSIEKPEITFKEKCLRLGFTDNKDIELIRSYKKRHKGFTDNEVLVHYRPDLRLNIFGNIILPNGEILK